jgi:hypothetical protein
VKHQYLEVCSSKEKFLTTLECGQKAKEDHATLLDTETKKINNVQADLKTERQKASVAVAVLDNETTTKPLCGETLIDMQMINVFPFY